MSIAAEGWFIYAAGPEDQGRPARLVRESYQLEDLQADEVLLAPLYGCWEGNMGHALARQPVDVCATRGYDKTIIGNSGTARVLALGPEVQHLREGQVVLMFGMETDRWGYPRRMMAFDAPISGCLTTRMKMKEHWVIPIPDDTRFPLSRWAGFNVRYLTAWANWQIAYGVLRLHLSEAELPVLNVWGWGGGTALAETQLATLLGHRGVALASTPERLDVIRQSGVTAMDRGEFSDLEFEPKRYRTDEEYARRYQEAEAAFLDAVHRDTQGLGVQIFVDLVGAPVFRATVKALGRQGVVTTAGWKAGMNLSYVRAVECIARHQFVHTHFTRYSVAKEAIAFAEARAWLPIIDEQVYTFDQVPELAARYAAGEFRMFPCYQINAE